MLWRGISVGPALARDVRVGFDRAARLPVALRWLPAAAPAAVVPLPWPPEVHPNVARLLRVEPSGGGVVLVSELALGPTLQLLAGSPQPPSVVAGLCAQILAGLEALHGAGRAHGRLHPGNLVLDVQAASLRIQDPCIAAFEGVPLPGDARTLFVRPGSAVEGPSVAGDLYAVGRVAEALLRGGSPRLHWAALPPVGDPAAARLGEWIVRCQSLDPGAAFGSAAEARQALHALGAEGGQAFAHVRPGAWMVARRRADRALARWLRSSGTEPAGPADYADLVSSQRATLAWRRIGLGACGALLLSFALAVRPGGEPEAQASSSPAARSEIGALRAALLAAEAPDAGGPTSREPLEGGLVDPAAQALLDAAARATGDGGAPLPEDLEGPMHDLRTSLAAFREGAKGCGSRLRAGAEAALAVGRPDAPPSLVDAVERLAVERLAGDPARPDAEARLRAALHVEDSPMLDRALESVTGDAQVGRCVASLAHEAAKVQEALTRCAEPLEASFSDEALAPSAGSAR